MDRTNLGRLRQMLDTHFSEGELRDLCFGLGIDYQTLAGYSKVDKTRELVAYLDQQDQIVKLVQTCSRLRPRVSWLETLQSAEDFTNIARKYREYLTRRLHDHVIRGLSPQVSGSVLSLPLSGVFLPLRAVVDRPIATRHSGDDQRLQTSREFTDRAYQYRQHKGIEKHLDRSSPPLIAQRRLSLSDLLEEPRLVLLGDPGTGKTTTVCYITYALAANESHILPDLPNLVPALIRVADYARAYDRNNTLQLIEYIEMELTPQPEFGRYLCQAIEEGTSLIILDGLDEVTDPILRADVRDRIIEMAARFSDNHYIVTSRIVGYSTCSLTSDFVHATLTGLSPDDQERLVRLWYDAINSAVAQETDTVRVEQLVAALRARPNIAQMAANPLLLTITLLMHWRGLKLPARRVELFQISTDTLLEYWTAQRGVDLDATDLKQILAPIAYYILSSGVTRMIARDDLLRRLCMEIALQRGCGQIEARTIGDNLLVDLGEHSGLFLERGLGANGQPLYGFLHPVFEEYLASLHMVTEFLAGTFSLEGHLHRSIWHEPLLLMASHLSIYNRPHATALLRSILDFPAPYEDVLHRNLLFVVDCLADDIPVELPLRDHVFGQLARLIEHESPNVREAALDQYPILATTRHAEAAAIALRNAFAFDDPAKQRLSVETRFNLAIALLHLSKKEYAHLLLSSLEDETHEDRVRRLRFEGWPENASEYLLHLWEDKDYDFSIIADADLVGCKLGPVDAMLARRVLGTASLRTLIETLIGRVQSKIDQSALRWILAITTEPPLIEVITDLMKPDVPAEIRQLAATYLLDSDQRSVAIGVLHDLVSDDLLPLVEATQRLFRETGFELILDDIEDYKGGVAIPLDDIWKRRFAKGVYVAVVARRLADTDFIHRIRSHAQEQDAQIRHALLVTDYQLEAQDWLMIHALVAQGFIIVPLPQHFFSLTPSTEDLAASLLSYLDERLGLGYDPYKEQGPVYGAGNFFGRVAWLNKLETALLKGQPQALFGIRKFGKSSILYHLTTKIDLPVAVIDLQAGSMSIAGLYRRMLEGWVVSASRKLNVKWSTPQLSDGVSLRDDFVDAVHDLVRTLQPFMKYPRLAVFIDEAELLMPAPDVPSTSLIPYIEFMATLRTLSTGGFNPLSVLIASFDPALTRISHLGTHQNPAYELFDVHYLDPLSSDDCAQMIRSLGNHIELEFSQDSIDLVYQASGGHPFIARQICSLAYKQMKRRGQVPLELLQSVIESFIYNRNTASLLNRDGLWGAVTQPAIWGEQEAKAQGELLRFLARQDGPHPITDFLQGEGVASKRVAVEELRNLSIIKELPPGNYEITFGCFKDWIRAFQLSEVRP